VRTRSTTQDRHFEPPIKTTERYPLGAQPHQKSMMNSGPVPNWRSPRSGCQACFKVRVTSQNSPQLLVSKKCDLADSKGSDLNFHRIVMRLTAGKVLLDQSML